MLQLELEKLYYTITVKNALTVKAVNLEEADLILIGTPVHGYILFGHKPVEAITDMVKNALPVDLKQKPVIGFATYLFFPAGALKRIKNSIERRNGSYVASFANRRFKKQVLVTNIVDYITKNYPIE